MIKVRYEKYYNDYNKTQEVKTFSSLNEMSDWFFGLVQGEYKDHMYFVNPDNGNHNRNGKLNLNKSSLQARDGKYHYWIEQVEKNGAIIYSCGTFTNGICHWNEEMKQWLRDCRERVERPKFNFAYDEVKKDTGRFRFEGLNNVLKEFDNHGWKGTHFIVPWKICNGGYDLWFELYYQGEPVASCINGKLESNFGLEQSDKEELFDRILKIYDNLKIKEEPELEKKFEGSDEKNVKGDTSDFEKYIPSDNILKAVEILDSIKKEETLPYRLALMMLEIEENAPDWSLKEKMFLTERLLDSCYSSDVAIHSGERTWALSDLLSEGITENRNYYRVYDLPETSPENMKEALIYCDMDDFTNLIDYVAIRNSKYFLDDPSVEYFYEPDVMQELENTVKTTKKTKVLDDIIGSAEQSKNNNSINSKAKEQEHEFKR